MRTVADFDVDKAQRVYHTWPLREAMVSYFHKLQESALEAHRVALLQWASLRAMSKKLDPPRAPAILKERPRG